MTPLIGDTESVQMLEAMGRMNGKLMLNDWDTEKVLEMGRDDGCTTI